MTLNIIKRFTLVHDRNKFQPQTKTHPYYRQIDSLSITLVALLTSGEPYGMNSENGFVKCTAIMNDLCGWRFRRERTVCCANKQMGQLNLLNWVLDCSTFHLVGRCPISTSVIMCPTMLLTKRKIYWFQVPAPNTRLTRVETSEQ